MEVMAARELERCIDRLAFEISERMGSPSTYVLVGIVTGGDALARRLAARIGASEGAEPQVGSLDITLYRDDLYTGLEKPVLGETRIPSPSTASGWCWWTTCCSPGARCGPPSMS